MRIGIWCDYGFTLEPNEGIGVFVDNLARALVRADHECELVLMSHPGQESKLASTVAQGRGRIAVVSAPKVPRWRRKLIRLLKKFDRIATYYTPRKNPALVAATDKASRFAKKICGPLTQTTDEVIEKYVDSCDVWLLPYVGLERDFNKPNVVVVHDLVCYHFPEMLPAPNLAALKKVVNRIVGRATLAACMSNFIRENDLLGTLGLPPSRIRVVNSAVPDDLGISSASDENTADTISIPDGIESHIPFLFYPAAFRSYKNHAYLLDVLKQLKERSPRKWKLVFTGIRRCPRSLRAHINALGLSEDVLILGKVSREELEGLYLTAFATVVPSLYEQGSFPIMEALHCRCPAAAASIPPLREQFASMGDSMLFFDPHDPSSLVQVVEKIARNRDDIIDSQSAGFRSLRANTWENAAAEWLEVFREAIATEDRIEETWEIKRAA